MSHARGSREDLERALDAARDAGDPAEQARVFRQIAALDRAEGHDWRARRRLERALDLYREANDLRGVAAVLGELDQVAEAEPNAAEHDGDTLEADAPVTDDVDSDLIRMRRGDEAATTTRMRGGRLTPPPGGSRREGTSWPLAVGFLVLLLVVAGGLAFLAIRVVGDFLADLGGGDAETATSEGRRVPVTLEPEPEMTRFPVEGAERPGTLRATPQTCEVTGSEVFADVRMRVRLTASQPFELVVLRGTLTARSGREIGSGITPVTPVARGTRRIDMTFSVFERVPRGRLTCGVEIQTAVPAF